MAASRALRVRTLLPRTVSSSSRKPARSSGLMSSSASAVGALPSVRSAYWSNNVNASR